MKCPLNHFILSRSTVMCCTYLSSLLSLNLEQLFCFFLCSLMVFEEYGPVIFLFFLVNFCVWCKVSVHLHFSACGYPAFPIPFRAIYFVHCLSVWVWLIFFMIRLKFSLYFIPYYGKMSPDFQTLDVGTLFISYCLFKSQKLCVDGIF